MENVDSIKISEIQEIKFKIDGYKLYEMYSDDNRTVYELYKCSVLKVRIAKIEFNNSNTEHQMIITNTGANIEELKVAVKLSIFSLIYKNMTNVSCIRTKVRKDDGLCNIFEQIGFELESETNTFKNYIKK